MTSGMYVRLGFVLGCIGIGSAVYMILWLKNRKTSTVGEVIAGHITYVLFVLAMIWMYLAL